MNIVCKKCQTTFRIKDEKIPAKGAKIICPKCQDIFFIIRTEAGFNLSQKTELRPDPPKEKKASGPAINPLSAESIAPPVKEIKKGKERNLQKELDTLFGDKEVFNEFDLFPKEPPEAEQEDQISERIDEEITSRIKSSLVKDYVEKDAALEPGSPRKQRVKDRPSVLAGDRLKKETTEKGDRSEPEISAEPKSKRIYKVKTPIGLICEFYDINSLLKWLAAKESIESYLFSSDGTQWIPILEAKEVSGFSQTWAERESLSHPKIVLPPISVTEERDKQVVTEGTPTPEVETIQMAEFVRPNRIDRFGRFKMILLYIGTAIVLAGGIYLLYTQTELFKINEDISHKKANVPGFLIYSILGDDAVKSQAVERMDPKEKLISHINELYLKGAEAAKAKRFEEAILFYSEIIGFNKNEKEAYLQLYECYKNAQKWKEALDALKKYRILKKRLENKIEENKEGGE